MMAHQDTIENYRDLKVWQRGIDLVQQVCACTASFPSEEKFGLTAQVRRAAVSIPSNIAEGWGRGSTKDYMHFLRIARSFLLEVETQLIIAHRLDYIEEETLNTVLDQTEVESRMLLSLQRSLNK